MALLAADPTAAGRLVDALERRVVEATSQETAAAEPSATP
jgi:hypothetical protein